jgi:HK97 family phage major capsid protein
MNDMETLIGLVKSQGDAFEQFKTSTAKQVEEMDNELRQLVIKAGRPSLGASNPQKGKAAQIWLDTKTQKPVPVFSHDQSVAAFHGEAKSDGPSIGRMLRGIVLGGQAGDAKALEEERKALGISPDPSGGYTVPSALSGMWIDLLRSEMVLSRAGVMTVPMDTPTLSIARLTKDPAVFWHGENKELATGEPTFGAVNLHAKTVACVVRMSLELSQDSPNIDEILQRSITQAMAGAIDKAGLVGATVDAGATPMGIYDFAANEVLAIGTPAISSGWNFLADGMYELMVDNVPAASIGAMIGHPKIWQHMTKLKDSAGNPLQVPEDLAKLPKLWTTAAPFDGTTAKAVIGNWSDYLFGVRQDIQVKVLDQAFMGSHLQVAVLAVARVDFVTSRPQSFCTLEGITFA